MQETPLKQTYRLIEWSNLQYRNRTKSCEKFQNKIF